MRGHGRPATIAGLGLVVLAFVALVGMALSSALVYYVTPTELREHADGGAVRLYGIVVPGSVELTPAGEDLSFRVTDGETTVAVTTRAVPTALFREGVPVVLPGRAKGAGSFSADDVLVKHSEVYDPLMPGQTIPPGLLDEIRAVAE